MISITNDRYLYWIFQNYFQSDTCYFTNFKYIFKNITLYHKSCDTSAFLNGMHSFNINYDQLDINNANSEVYNT